MISGINFTGDSLWSAFVARGGDGGGGGGGDIESQAEADYQRSKTASQYQQAARSMQSAGVRNLSGQDRTNTSTGRSSSTVASSSGGRARGTSMATSGSGLGAGMSNPRGRAGSTNGGGSSGSTATIGGYRQAANSMRSAGVRNLSGTGTSRVATGMTPGFARSMTSQGLANLGGKALGARDLSGYDPLSSTALASTYAYDWTKAGLAPTDGKPVDTRRAIASPTGFEADATKRATKFSTDPLSFGPAKEYDFSKKSDRVQYTYDQYRAAGYTHEQAAGVLGNFEIESGFNPSIKGDGGAAHGLAQWNDRADSLKEFAAEQGKDWTDFPTQVAFALHEKQTSEAAAGRALKSAQTAEEAAKVVSNKYERPGTPHMSRRVAAANRFASSLSPTEQARPDQFSGSLDVAVIQDGEYLDEIDRPGSGIRQQPINIVDPNPARSDASVQVATGRVDGQEKEPEVAGSGEQRTASTFEGKYLGSMDAPREVATRTVTPAEAQEEDDGQRSIPQRIAAGAIDVGVGLLPGVGTAATVFNLGAGLTGNRTIGDRAIDLLGDPQPLPPEHFDKGGGFNDRQDSAANDIQPIRRPPAATSSPAPAPVKFEEKYLGFRGDGDRPTPDERWGRRKLNFQLT